MQHHLDVGGQQVVESFDCTSSSSSVAAVAATAASGEQVQQRPHRSTGPLANLRKGYQLLRELLSNKPASRRSQIPAKLPRFADPLTSWRLALAWLKRITDKLGVTQIRTPVFNRHGCFEDLESRCLSEDQFRLDDGQLLQDRLLQLTGSGHLVRQLSDHLGKWIEAPVDAPSPPSCSSCSSRSPRQELLLLPLSFETTASHHHPFHHHHQQQHLHCQSGLKECEDNFSAFHRFLASLLAGAEASAAAAAGSEAGCELRVALGKQCAECSPMCLLQRSQHHASDSALSVLLLHLLTLMLVLGEHIPQQQRGEILRLWENRLQPEALMQDSTVKVIRSKYSALMQQ